MLTALFILIPGLIAAAYYRKLIQAEWQAEELLVRWGIFAFFINLFALGIIFLHGNLHTVTAVFKNILRLLKYGGVSFLLAIAMPNLLFLVRKIFCQNNVQVRKESQNADE